MEYEISAIECNVCHKAAIIGVLSIGTEHQFVKEVICPACVTSEHLVRLGKQKPEVVPVDRRNEPG